MKQTPKKLNFLIVAMLMLCVGLLTVFINSCKKSSSNNDDIAMNGNIITSLPGYITLNNLPKEYEVLGKIHNEGMDSVFNTLKTEIVKYQSDNKLKSLKVNNLTVRPKFDVESVLKNAVDKFLKGNSVIKGAYSKLTPNLINSINNKLVTNKFHPNIAVNDFDSAPKMSNDLKILLNRVDDALTGKFKTNSLFAIKDEFEDINKSAKTLSHDEANVLYAATSVGFASYQYWFKNYRKWYFASKYPSLLSKFTSNQLNHIYLKKKQPTSMQSTSRLKTASTDTLPDSTKADTSKINWLSEVVITAEANDNSPSQDDVNSWWNKVGKDVVKGDIAGACAGGIAGFNTGMDLSEGALTFGPEGVIITVGGATIGGAALGAIDGSMVGFEWGEFWQIIGW